MSDTATPCATPGSDQLKGLIGQAEFLRTGGKAPGGPFAVPRVADLPAFGPSNTKIRLPTHPQYLPGLPKSKRK